MEVFPIMIGHYYDGLFRGVIVFNLVRLKKVLFVVMLLLIINKQILESQSSADDEVLLVKETEAVFIRVVPQTSEHRLEITITVKAKCVTVPLTVLQQLKTLSNQTISYILIYRFHLNYLNYIRLTSNLSIIIAIPVSSLNLV